MHQAIKITLLMIFLGWQGSAVADIVMGHRLINTKAVAGGTEVTLHLYLHNNGDRHYYDLTVTPVDPALLPTPNEKVVSLARLSRGQRATVPWKVVLPYHDTNEVLHLPIAFQGSASDDIGMMRSVHTFSTEGAM